MMEENEHDCTGLVAFVMEYDMPIVDIYCLAEDENMAVKMCKHGYPEGKPFTMNPVNESIRGHLLSFGVRGYMVVPVGHTVFPDLKGSCPFVRYHTREEKINAMLSDDETDA